MKRCPTCNKTFTDSGLSFCVDDGTPLITDPPDDEATVVRPRNEGDTSSGSNAAPERERPPYQPPSYTPPGSGAQTNRRTWPLLVGLLVLVVVVFAGLGIAAVILFPKVWRASSNANAGNVNTNRRVVDPGVYNRNLGTPEVNANSNSPTDPSAPPPTDREVVLADLKNLEDEWTVANINADKSKLDRILADDYVGITNGRAQGKAEYIKTIEREPAIQHWEFDNLKVSLNGDRATLTGTVKFDVTDDKGGEHELDFLFIDKFVWRDGRWQATSSEVNPVEKPPGVST